MSAPEPPALPTPASLCRSRATERPRRAAAEPMRILIHDFAGHPFQVQLARELARRQHRVLHLHFQELQTPKGNVLPRPSDPATFTVEGVRLGEAFDKWSFLHRRRQELRYGAILAARVRRFGPDVVLSANTPLDVQGMLIAACKTTGAALVIWVQDFYSVAVAYAFRKKLGSLGRFAAIYYGYVEKQQLRRCQQIIYITSDFLTLSSNWNLATEKCHVIENWAPLDEIRPLSRDNDWARRHDLADKFCIVYSGTMGWKHNPRPLLAIAERWRDDDRVKVVIVAEGPSREWLAQQKTERDLDNLVILNFQPYERLPEVLATADVLVALLESDAGTFSVPSKVLSYLCAGRPILLVAPEENLAARIVTEAGAGFVARVDDDETVGGLTDRLIRDAVLRARLGASARRYAEDHFNIVGIGDRFERILAEAGQKQRSKRPGSR